MNPAIDTLNETLEVTTPAAAKNRRRPRYFIAAALVGAAALAVIGTLPRLERRAVLADAKVRVEASPRVSVVGPRPAPKEVVLTLPGGTQAIQDTTLYARTSGFLSQRMVDIGDRVEAGQLLAVIEAPELDQDLERASVHLEEARANLTLARSTLQRIRSLLQAHAVSEQEYDDQKVRVNSAEAAEKAGQADVRRLTALQSYERVVAPFAGTITARNVDKGALVTSGSGSSLSSLFSIADTSGLRVFIDVPQTAAAGIAEHQDAEVLLRELPGKVFQGKVVRTARAIDPATRTLRTELFLPNLSGELLPGMYVQVKLTVGREHPGVLIPARTLVLRKEGPQVVVVTPDRKTELRPVKLGRDFGSEIEVIQGLDGRELLVENPTDELENGQTVRVEGPPRSSPGTKLAQIEKNR